MNDNSFEINWHNELDTANHFQAAEAQTVSEESNNPIDFFFDHPLNSSLAIGGLLIASLAVSWSNRRNAEDHSKAKQNITE